MELTTTFIDVIENHLGQSLVPENVPGLEKLTTSQLEELGDVIEFEFTSQDYVGLPRAEEGEVVFTFGAFSRSSQIKPWMNNMRGSLQERVGELYAALVYLPSVAIPTEMESVAKRGYHNKLFSAFDQDEMALVYKNRFIEELAFFASIRELTRKNAVIPIPEQVALKPAPRSAEQVFKGAIQELASLDYFKSVRIDLSGAYMMDSEHSAITSS